MAKMLSLAFWSATMAAAVERGLGGKLWEAQSRWPMLASLAAVQAGMAKGTDSTS